MISADATFGKNCGMPLRAWYRDWFNSDFYHKLYFERDENEASQFIDKLIVHLGLKPGQRILDVACGKGRHSRIMADKGAFVTGIDISASSIAYAKEFETDLLEFFQHDMRLPFRVNYYHFAFNFFTSFGYFSTRREHDDTMRTIANALLPEGKVVFDYLNVHYVEDNLVPNEIKQIDSTKYEIHRWHDDDHFFKKITISDPTLKTPLSYTEKVSKFSLGDFTEMMAYQEIQVQEVFGNYKLEDYDVRKRERMIIVGKK